MTQYVYGNKMRLIFNVFICAACTRRDPNTKSILLILAQKYYLICFWQFIVGQDSENGYLKKNGNTDKLERLESAFFSSKSKCS